MKKTFIQLAIILMTNIVVAQTAPQFTHNHCFKVNDSSKIGFAVYIQSFDTILKQKGNNYTWNFSSAGWTAPTVSYKFQPSTQSSHSLFHSTQINEYAQLTFGRDLFYTYSSNSDTLYNDGLYTSTNYLYKPRIPYLTFPMNINDSVYSYKKQYANPNNPNAATGSITRYWIYDGFGTVQLPYGNISNVYRIRTKQIDSTYILNSGTTYEELIWFRQSDGIPVLRFLKNSTIISAYYASATSISSIAEFDKYNFSFYPNPAGENIFINCDSKLIGETINISDISGKVLVNKIITSHNQTIDISNLAAGVYLVNIDGNYQKLIKH